MAEAIVSVLVQQLSYFMYHAIENEVTMFVGVKEDIRNLTRTLKTIHAVLHDAENKQFKEKRVKVWLEDLTEAVYEIEDVLDQWNTNILKSQLKKESLGSSKHVVSHLFYPCFCIENSVFSRHSVGQNVKELRNNLESIARNKKAYGLTPGTEANVAQPREGTSPLVNEPDVYGREDDRNKIVTKILDKKGHCGVGVPVISIVGIGGLGKTTLAQYILHHQKVVERFKTHLWVCVSHPFDRISIAKAIIVQAGGNLPDNNEWSTLHCLLKETLKNKVFLLILDDVWTENLDEWNPFKICLDGGLAGSQILITTRKVRVAEMMNSVYTLNLQGLNNENSWSLLQFAACIKDKTEDYEALQVNGKAIALKCKGVPLSVKTIGSLLRFKKTKPDWEMILKSEMWSLPKFVDTVILSLNYYDLPSSWKPCFLYCATFPKNRILKKDVLIKLWMAHGFLYSSEGRELEEIGEDYFNSINEHSLFQDLDKDGSGDIQSCKLHDLVHGFVHFLSNKKTCIIEGNDVTFNNPNLHHLTVCGLNMDITTVPSFDTVKSVRTLNFTDQGQVGGLKKILCHWTNLRSLDISNTGLELLPPEIEKLVHLRYLDLSRNSSLKKLPNTLGNLCNLQTLKLNGCSELRKLPASMGKLINLRHLELDSTDKLRSLPKGIEKLSSLRSLSKFIVEEGRKLSDMKRLNLLQRKVEISGLRRDEDAVEAKEADLGNKRGIRDLALIFRKYGKVREGDEIGMEGVLEALQPPPELEKLRIVDYPSSKLASWMNDGSQLLKLRVLELLFNGESKCTQLTSLGKLPLLEELSIYNMRSLQRLDFFGICENKEDASNPIVAFPKLKKLKLSDMFKLEDWKLPFERSDIIQIMPSLRTLHIVNADKLKVLPPVWKLESLQELSIAVLDSVTRICPELFGISENDVMGMGRDGESLPINIFPNLLILEFRDMMELEKWEMKMPNWREHITFLMPCLRELQLHKCPKLKVIPQNIYSYQLVEEKIHDCPELKLPPDGIIRLSRGKKLKKVHIFILILVLITHYTSLYLLM